LRPSFSQKGFKPPEALRNLVGKGPHMAYRCASIEKNAKNLVIIIFQKFLEVQEPFFKKVPGGCRAAPCPPKA
jgi:hypothetical protein